MLRLKYESMKRSGDTYTAMGEFGSKQELFQLIKDRGETLLSSEEIKKVAF